MSSYFKHNDDGDVAVGCITIIILLAIGLFIPPLVVKKAWDVIAVAKFGLPVFTYWEMFWGCFVIDLLGSSFNYSNKK